MTEPQENVVLGMLLLIIAVAGLILILRLGETATGPGGPPFPTSSTAPRNLP